MMTGYNVLVVFLPELTVRLYILEKEVKQAMCCHVIGAKNDTSNAGHANNKRYFQPVLWPCFNYAHNF